MSTAETPPSSLEVAVAEDGSIQVPASEVARLGLGPGARLRLVPQSGPRASGQSSWGVLAGKLPDIAWEDSRRPAEWLPLIMRLATDGDSRLSRHEGRR